MLKRSLAVILALVLVLSCCAVSVGAVDYQPVDSYTVNEDTPYTEEAIIACGGSLEDTQTIYFQAPADWANQFNTFDGPDDSEPYMHVCIYWWEGVGSKWPDGTGVQWVGYQTHLIDKENRIYSATVPDDVTSKVIWNNGVNGGMDPYGPMFNYSRLLADANIEGAAADDFDTLPEGSPVEDNMDQCIQIINYDPELAQENPLTGFWNYGSDWYVYYGDGCYGYYPTYSENYDGQAENCVNPEHFDSNGNHVGFVPSTDEPADPNDIPDVSGDKIYFYAPSAGWEDASRILFYIYEIGGEELAAWGSKKLRGTNEGNGVWSYDAAALGVEPGRCYGLILNNSDTGAATYDLLLDTSCFGDIAYADLSTRIENPVDSNKSSIKTRWKNSTTCGPRLQITSIGKVVGETVPDNMTVYQMFVDFLASKGNIGLQNALNYNGRDAQTTIDDVASALGMTQEDVTLAIRDAATVGDPYGDKTDWSREWSAERSYLPSGNPSTDEPADPNDIPDVSGDKIYFYAPSAGWEDASRILFYIYEIGGEELAAWGSKKLRGTNEGNGVWSYDAAALGVEPGKCYGLILNNSDTGAQTYDLLLDTSCFGDIAYADLSTRIENPVDSNKSSIKTRWKNSTTCGPRLQITSIGNVVGETVPDNMTAYQMFVGFLASKGNTGLQNALNYNGRDAQTTIDDVASALGLTQEDVTLAIRDAATVGDPYGDKTDWSREWSAERSYLPSEDPRYNNDYYRFYQYLTEELPELRKTSIKPDQYLVDDEARERGLKKADVQYVFDKYYVEGIEWEPENCKLESGYHYQEGGYYLFSTDEDSEYNIRHIPGYYAFGLDRLTGYYTLDLSNVNVGARLDAVKPLEHVAVAEYSDGVFRKVSGDLTSADAKLYFFRPQEDGYGFGYNTAAELPDGSSSSSSGSSSGSTYPLKTPEIKSITSTVDGLKVTWDAVSGAQKYRLYVRGADGWDRISEQTGTSYTYTNVTSGNAVNFTVRCVSSDGNTFMSDYNRYGRSGRYLDAPKITSLDSSKEGVEISWDPVPGNAMYRVYVKYLDSWKALGDTYSTSFLHSSRGDGSIYAQPETEYTYTVRCLSYNGKVLTSDYDHEGKTIFFDPPFDLRGDADGNGEIEAIDVTIIQRYADWMIAFTFEDMARADVDGDAWADITDATAIQYYLTGLSTPYPVGERYYS